MAKETSPKIIKKTMSKEVPKAKKAVKVIKKMRSVSAVKPVTPKMVFKDSKFIVLVKVLLVIAIGTVIFLLIQKYQGLFVAGSVNKSPIMRWELNSRMAEKYGEQVLEEIISERLLAENLKKNKIDVTESELKVEYDKIVAQYGGEEQFKAAIAQYNMTKEKALASIKQSIGLKKIIESLDKIEITDDAINKYFTDNKAIYATKKLEEVKDEIKEALYQQEIYTKSQEWYAGIREAAKVSNFL